MLYVIYSHYTEIYVIYKIILEIYDNFFYLYWIHIEFMHTYVSVSICFNLIISSLSQKSLLHINIQLSPVSPSPLWSPYADTSCFPLKGELTRCEWRFFFVEICSNLIISPHLIGFLWKKFPQHIQMYYIWLTKIMTYPRMHLFPDSAFTNQ